MITCILKKKPNFSIEKTIIVQVCNPVLNLGRGYICIRIAKPFDKRIILVKYHTYLNNDY